MILKPHKKQIKKLLEEKRRTVSHFQSLRKEAEDSDEREYLLNGEKHEVGMIDDEIYSLETQYLLEQARNLLLPMPKHDENEEYWEKSQFTRLYQLTRHGMQELRSTIRSEKRARREWIAVWVAGLIGLIGAISGLVALWKD